MFLHFPYWSDSFYVMLLFIAMKPPVTSSVSDSFFLRYNPLHLKIILQVRMLVWISLVLNKLKISPMPQTKFQVV